MIDPKARQAAIDRSVAAAVKADRERCSIIIQSEAAQRQPTFAAYIANSTNLSVEQAIGCLVANAKDIAAYSKVAPNAFAQFMDSDDQPNVGASVRSGNGEDGDEDDGSGSKVAAMCRGLGLKGFAGGRSE